MAAIYWKSTDDIIYTPVARLKAPPVMGANAAFIPVLGRRNPIRHYRREVCTVDTGTTAGMVTHLTPRYETCSGSNRDKIARSDIVSRNSEKYAKYSNTMGGLLRKRCVTYDQRLGGVHNGTTYTKKIGNCDKDCTTTYNPSNKKFSNQGAVDSSTRLNRLKQDTIKTNFKSLSDTYGINTANTLHSIPSYTLKSKVNVCNSSLYRRNGSKLVCP
jgi:hypothetical protein